MLKLGITKEKSKELENLFLEKEKKWILIVDHEILDEIENAIEECIAFYNAEDDMEFESSSNKLKNAIESLAFSQIYSIVAFLLKRLLTSSSLCNSIRTGTVCRN